MVKFVTSKIIYNNLKKPILLSPRIGENFVGPGEKVTIQKPILSYFLVTQTTEHNFPPHFHFPKFPPFPNRPLKIQASFLVFKTTQNHDSITE